MSKAKFWASVAWLQAKSKLSKLSQELQAAEYIEKNATRGNPMSVLAAFDQFCYASNWMMNVGFVDTKELFLTAKLLFLASFNRARSIVSRSELNNNVLNLDHIFPIS